MTLLTSSIFASSLAILALTVQPAIASDQDGITEEAKEQSKKPKKGIDRRHPDYVRCRSEAIIGSLARKRRICMTNQEWAEYNEIGSRYSREFVEDSQPGFMKTTPD